MAEMERLKDGHLSRALERNREYFNAAFAIAGRQNQNLNSGDFAEHVIEFIEPAVHAVGELAPDRVDETVRSLYDVSLDLFEQDCLGANSRHPIVSEAWKAIFPKIPKFIAASPRQVAMAILNGAYNISIEPGGAARRWISEVVRLAGKCVDEKQFLAVGKVVAWRIGMAHYRDSAIPIWRNLPDELLFETIGIGSKRGAISRSDLIKAMDNPWQSPEQIGQSRKPEICIASRTGGFRGFGEYFIAPPKVSLNDGKLVVYDEESGFALYADVFGTVLKKIGDFKPGKSEKSYVDFSIDSSGTVSRYKDTKYFPLLTDFASFAATQEMLVVTMPSSHHVYVVVVM